ncbi:MAG: type II toxin-antitoxin system VapC family toxin [Gammaproteobacteria bacterium]
MTAFEQKNYGAEIAFAPTTVLHAQIAAQARHAFRINLGDCFAYALAVTENLPLFTLPWIAISERWISHRPEVVR